jgi:YVTN family beta-propeller protein
VSQQATSDSARSGDPGTGPRHRTPRAPRRGRPRSTRAGRLIGLVGTTVALALAAYYLFAPGSGPARTPASDRLAGGGATTSQTTVPPPAPATGVDVYAHTRVGMLSPAVAGDLPLVYVPNLGDGTVTVIDQRTLKVINTFATGAQPQHVVPSWDLKTLWVNNNAGNSLSPINPRTGTLAGPSVPVTDPYNLYFTPDGRYAMVMAEALHRIDFRDPHTFALIHSLDVGTLCAGVNHADFSPDGTYAIATCEFAGRLVKIDLRAQRVIGYLDLGRQSAPQDIKIDRAGKLWYVADMNDDGVHLIDGDRFIKVGFIQTGPETHGLYPSRDGKYLYIANRGGTLMSTMEPFPHSGDHGSVSVIDFATHRVVANWAIPGGGTPDMGNVSADGTRLWLSGRRSNVVYVFDTGFTSGGDDPGAGRLLTEIRVGREPHGLAVWPLPGRFSLGHTGILR